ncbi:MAG: ABC transporter ATP-binding protein [Marinomonas colpomeniae]
MKEIKTLFDIVGHIKITIYIIMLSLFVALIEFVGLSLIVPYISIAVSQKIPDNEYLYYFLRVFNIQGFQQFMLFASILIVSFYLFRLMINLLFSYISLRLFNKIRHVLMSKLFSHYAHIDYGSFAFRNSINFKKTLLQESLNAQVIIKSMIDIISESFVLLALIGLIVYVDWVLAIVLGLVFGLMFYLVTFLVKSKINTIADERKKYSTGLHKYVDEILNNFKFIKLVGAENIGIKGFDENSYGLFRVNSLFQLLNQSPKFILETFGLIAIAIITYYLTQSNSSGGIIGTLGVYAVAFYRALPSLNRIISSYNNFQYFKNTIDQVSEDLKIEREENLAGREVMFKNKLILSNVTFKHKGTETLLFDQLKVMINKGDKVAIIGKSGCGKSTLVDILMGILKPSNGLLSVDDVVIDDTNMRAWRKKFGYIPQEIYLYDGTVSDNVAFGREYDEQKVVEVLKQANIYNYLKMKDGLETMVGEGGVKLSGGQKQRIGIARALYGDPEILVLDEATSGLDYETEASIMDEIYEISKDKTLIVIAHRLSTIENCEIKISL